MADAKNMPYHVVTSNGTLHSGHDGPAQAQAAAFQANKQAEGLGIQTRYVVRERDAA